MAALAERDFAVSDFDRLSPLKNSRAISLQDWERARMAAEAARQKVSSTEYEVETAKAQLGVAQAARRELQVLQRQAVSLGPELRQLIAQRDRALIDLSDRVITAPFAGVLGFRQVSPGTLVTPGTTIASLDDVSVIKLDFSVPESFLSALAPGQGIRATSVAYPDQDFTGEVATIDSRVDPVSRAVTVRADVPNPDRLLRPGMLLTVDVFQPERQALVVPEIAVIQVSRTAHVFRVKDDNTVEQVDVELGQRRRGEVEILDGLVAGDRIVVDGTVKLRDGSAISDVTPAP